MSLDLTTLLHFLLQHGRDYTKVPSSLQHVSRRQMQRAWHKRELPTHTDHVVLALLKVDPPPAAKRHRT